LPVTKAGLFAEGRDRRVGVAFIVGKISNRESDQKIAAFGSGAFPDHAEDLDTHRPADASLVE
jgi:hypothetical protein